MPNKATSQSWTVACLESKGFKGVYDLKNKEQALDLSGLLAELGIGSQCYSFGYYDELEAILGDVSISDAVPELADPVGRDADDGPLEIDFGEIRDYDMQIPDDFDFSSPPDLTPVSQGLDCALGNRRRTAPKKVLAKLNWVGQDWDPYLSLVPDKGCDLTQWQLPAEDGTVSAVALQRLLIHPIILNPSGRMGFARVGRSRITYVRQVVAWTDSVRIGDRNYSLEVSFPKDGLEVANMHLTLRPVSRPTTGLQLQVRFDGQRGVLTGSVILQVDEFERMRGPVSPTMDELRCMLSDSDSLESLLQQALKPFRFSTLGRENRNATDFFPHKWLHLTLFRYGGCSVLAASDV